MKKFSFISFLFLASGVLADSPKEFLWFSGTKNLTPIDLSAEHPKTTNLTYSYAVDCNDQKSDQAGLIYDCKMDNITNKLTIDLKENATGNGTIVVRAIGVDDKQQEVDKKVINFKVSVVAPAEFKLRECAQWDCKVGNSFYLGYEGTSVNEVDEKGNVRFQYSGYAQFSPSHHTHIHVLGDLMQTSPQEQVAVKEECRRQNIEGEETESGCEVDPTVAGSLGLFVPFYWKEKTQLIPGDIIMGPWAEYSIRKLDTADEFVPSYYFNYRFAHSKIRFFSLGYGKSEGIPGGRIKFTGQVPIYQERLIAGFTMNMAADNEAKKAGLNPGDSINLYILTNVNFGDIFSNFKD